MNKKNRKGKDVIFQKIDNKLIGFDINKSSLYTLNETAEIIYKKAKKGMTEKSIAEFLVQTYGIDLKTAVADVKSTLIKLKKNNII